MEKVVTAKGFWDVYSKKLNAEGNWEAYQNDGNWTPVVTEIACQTCKDLGLETLLEYYKVDVIGYRRDKPEKDGNWWLDVAYEHENRNTWWEELCKLCYVATDLRVISSYYNLGNEGKTVEDRTKEYLGVLKKEKICRIPNSEWLFVFGPTLVCPEQPFRAFTVDEKLSVIPVDGGVRVVPKEWKENNT